MWPSGIEEWSRAYEPHLKIWLEAMEEEEKGAEFLYALPLSVYRQESWKMGRFWLNYAARKSGRLMLSFGRTWTSGSLANGSKKFLIRTCKRHDCIS